FRHFANGWGGWLYGDLRTDRACRARRLDGSRLRHHSACPRLGLLRRFRADPERSARVARCELEPRPPARLPFSAIVCALWNGSKYFSSIAGMQSMKSILSHSITRKL